MPAAADPTTGELLMFVSAYMQKLLRLEARKQRIRWNALMVLNDLDLLGPCSQRTLADIEQIRAPTLTVLARQMEARGWLRRSSGAGDARVSIVTITEKGRAEVRRTNERLRERVDEELRRIPFAEQDTLGRSLLPLVRALMRALRDQPPSHT
jgi:DNA-binding MarR family transcriptional regulator